MFELDEVAREVKRLSDEVLLLTGLVRELQILVEREIGIVQRLKCGAPRWPDMKIMNDGRVNL